MKVAKLSTNPNPQLIKMMYLGQSGAGKSSSLIPLGIPDYLGNPGYELRVLDFDSKFEEVVRTTLARMLKEGKINKAQHDTALTENFDIAVCADASGVVMAREGTKTIKKIGVKGISTAWPNAIKQLEKWSTSFSDKTILVVDSFTHAVRAIVNYAQELNNKLNQTLTWNDYAGPQQLAENFIYTLSDLQTHVIVTGHADPLEIIKPTTRLDDKGKPIEELVDVIMAPISVGKAGRVKLPSKMNHLLVASADGQGSAVKRYIYTTPHVGVTTKTPYFGLCEDRYLIDKGMIEYFALSR